MQSRLIPSPVAIHLSLLPSCVPAIIISDPQMTLRDGCYLKHMHSSSSSSRQWGGVARGGWVEGGDGEVEIHSAHKFFSPAVPMYYAWDCCAYFKGLLDSVYIYTHTHKMVLSACSQLHYMVSEIVCVWERIIRCLPVGVGGSLEQEARESEPERWGRLTEEMSRNDKQREKREVVCVRHVEQERTHTLTYAYRHTHHFSSWSTS